LTQIALPYLAVASVHGADAVAFLHAQLSADIEGLEPGEATFACYCSPRGQVYGLLMVFRSGDSLRVVAAAELLPGIVERLRKFVLRARVTIETEENLSVFGMPVTVASEAVPGTDTAQPLPQGPRYRLAAGSPEPAGSSAEWKAQELGAGIAWLGAATSERFIPQMLGFDDLGAVSFRKGCYPGQEIIARARYLGQVKRRPLRLRVDGMPGLAAGTTVELQAGSEWQSATVIDSSAAEATAGTLLFLVTAVTEDPVEVLRYGDRDYGCATM